MLLEVGISGFAAVTAHSPAMLAFGSDSLVELLSATIVLMQWTPGFAISQRFASRTAGVLLYVLAVVVGAIALGSIILHRTAEVSCAGIGITAAALIVMPTLAVLKRREARRSRNAALAADAVQSATCAYLAAIALIGLGVNAVFHIGWIDSAAALAAIPLLIVEGRKVMRGESCGCC